MNFNKGKLIGIAILSLIIGLANSGSHPTTGTSGYTGAPNDSFCGASCHTGGNTNINGEITIEGLPSNIMTDQIYTITVRVTNPNGNAVKAGFQLLALTGTNTNAGNMTNNSPNTEIKTVSGNKKYFGHSPSINFTGTNELVYTVDWTAPATTGSNPVIKFYASCVIANGNGSNSGDRVTLTNQIIPISGSSSAPSVFISNVSGTTCSNTNNGSATANATGGNTPYAYLWSNGATNMTTNTLSPGTATVTVTDFAGSTATASTNISSPPTLTSTAFGSTICIGANNGTVSAVANGGTGGYFYQWSNGGSGSSQSNLVAGTYTVTVSDANSCLSTSQTTISLSPNITITSSQTNVSCNGGNNGSISINVSGGTPNISYNWSNGANTSQIFGLAAGNYSVTVTDAVFCIKTSSFTISQPTAMISSFSNVIPVMCNGGNNGAATINVIGGSPPYNFSWSNGSNGSGTSHTINNLLAGTYIVTATDLLNCQSTSSVQITQPQAINIQVLNIQNATCNGANNGAISVTVPGNISYLWSTNQSTSAITNLSPGNYTVTVTDNAASCTQSATYSISQPNALISNVSLINNVSCANGNNGAASASAVGGNGNYNYLWSTGSTSNTVSNLTQGIYTVTVTDLLNCTSASSINITQPTPIGINLVEIIPITCIGAQNGSIEVNAVNGISPFQYSWSNGNTTALNANIGSGNYTVTVTDNNSCSKSSSYFVGSLASFSLELQNIDPIICFGDSTGSASVLNNDNFNFLWSNGDSTSMINNVIAGNYYVFAVDNEGCESDTLFLSIPQSTQITATVDSADMMLCLGETNGFLDISIGGGIGTLVFNWSSGDTTLFIDSLFPSAYVLNVSDSLNCLSSFTYHILEAPQIVISNSTIQNVSCFGGNNGQISLSTLGGAGPLVFSWSNTSSNDTNSNLISGMYNVMILDSFQCSILDTFMVNQPDSVSTIVDVTNVSETGANDGIISVMPLGGIPAYAILWTSGDTIFVRDSLSPGSYSYTITDQNGCIFSEIVEVETGLCSFAVSYNITNPICFNSFDGVLSLQIIGNQTMYNASLYSSDTLVFYPLDSIPVGIYSLVVEDSTSCSISIDSIAFTSVNPMISINQIIKVNPTTMSSTDGSLTALASGGTGQLSYLWIKNGIVIGTSASIGNLGIGIYTLEIFDASSCMVKQSPIILEAPNASIDQENKTFVFSPNPAKDDLNIRYASEKVSLDIFNSHGKLIYSRAEISLTNFKASLDELGIQHSGMYVLKIGDQNKHVIKKFMVIK